MLRHGPCSFCPKRLQVEPSGDSALRCSVSCECGRGRSTVGIQHFHSRFLSSETPERLFRTRKGPPGELYETHPGHWAEFLPHRLHDKLLLSHQSPAYMSPLLRWLSQHPSSPSSPWFSAFPFSHHRSEHVASGPVFICVSPPLRLWVFLEQGVSYSSLHKCL